MSLMTPESLEKQLAEMARLFEPGGPETQAELMAEFDRVIGGE